MMARFTGVGCVVLLLVSVASCASDPTVSSEYQTLNEEAEALGAENTSLASQIEDLRSENASLSDQLADAAVKDEVLPSAVEGFKTAFESGDLDMIQDLFTDDGILTTTDKVHELYWGGDFHLATWDKEGSEFRRLTSIHQGEMLITEVIEVGDRTVAFDWEWEDFASGTAILHLRGDKIAVAVLSVTEVEVPQR